MSSIIVLLLLLYHFDGCAAKFHSNLVLSRALKEFPEANYFKVHALSGSTTPNPLLKQLFTKSLSPRQQANQYDPYMIAQIIANFDAIRAGNININLPRQATNDDIARAAGAPDYARLQGWRDTRLYERIPTVVPSLHTLPTRPGGPLRILIQRPPYPTYRPNFPGPAVPTSTVPNVVAQPTVNRPASPSQRQPGTSGGTVATGQGHHLHLHTPPNPQQIAQIIANFDALITGRVHIELPKKDRTKDGIARAAGGPNFKTLNGWKKSGQYAHIPTATPSAQTLPRTAGGPVPYLVNGNLYHPPSPVLPKATGVPQYTMVGGQPGTSGTFAAGQNPSRSPSPSPSTKGGKSKSPSRGGSKSPRRNG